VLGDTLEGGDTRVKAIKSSSGSDSDEPKKVARFFRKKRGMTPSVAAPGITHPSYATDRTVDLISHFCSLILWVFHYRHPSHAYQKSS